MGHIFPEIVVSDLVVGFKDKEKEKRLIEGLTARLRAGEIISLMGSNGCGKSTLLRTLTGFQLPLSGEVRMNGKVISAISMKERAGFISYVSTEPVRVGNMTVSDLVGLGRYLYSGWWGNLSDEDIRVVNRCLEITGMKNFASREVNSLSDGERQRAMIARALAQDTPVIILDEPTAFLDVRNKYEIIHLLRELAEQERKSVIFSSHDLSITMGMADKVWLIEKGKIVEGAPEDLAMNGSFNALFEGSPITFVPESGEIIMTDKPEKRVNIVSVGNKKDWLVKALLRKGYINDCNSLLMINTHQQDNDTYFSIEMDGGEQKFNSLYELLIGLKEIMG